VPFHERNIINAWEYGFQQSTMTKRILTPKQMETRMAINSKILASIKRLGISEARRIEIE
jgi:homospermidine synthase